MFNGSILTHSIFSYDEFRTALAKAAALINSRPVTAIASEADDILPITPSSFLFPGLASPIFQGMESSKLKQRYKYIQNRLKALWARYLNEYIPTLHARQKWLESTGSKPKLNDVVYLLDRRTEYGRFPLAKIIDLSPNRIDGIPRTATVKDSKGNVFIRSIRRLAPVSPVSQDNTACLTFLRMSFGNNMTS